MGGWGNAAAKVAQNLGFRAGGAGSGRGELLRFEHVPDIVPVVADVVVGQAQVLAVKGKPLRHRKWLLDKVLHDIRLKRGQIIALHPENGLPQGGLCFARVAAEIGRNAAAKREELKVAVVDEPPVVGHRADFIRLGQNLPIGVQVPDAVLNVTAVPVALAPQAMRVI